MKTDHPYHKRCLENKLVKLFQSFPVVVVSGARQVGKSTLIEHLFPEIHRVVLAPEIDIENANSEPDLFLKNQESPLFLDEIQYAPNLVPAMKRRLDEDRRPGQYLVTGSQQWEVMKLLSESLAGRATFVDLDSFAISEVQNKIQHGILSYWLEHESVSAKRAVSGLKQNTLYQQVWRGFMPEAQFLDIDLIQDFFRSYERTYIQRDVRQLSGINDLQLFGRFYRLCAAMTGQEINYNEIGRDIGVTPQTASRWLGLLKTTFQWFELPPWFGNTIKRVSRKPKGYFADTGMACFAMAISQPQAIASHPQWGHLFETAVVHELRKQSRFMIAQPNLYHWRAHSGAEVDIVVEWNGRLYPIEVKSKQKITKQDARGIKAFQDAYRKNCSEKGLILAPVSSSFFLTENVVVAPWDTLIDNRSTALSLIAPSD